MKCSYHNKKIILCLIIPTSVSHLSHFMMLALSRVCFSCLLSCLILSWWKTDILYKVIMLLWKSSCFFIEGIQKWDENWESEDIVKWEIYHFLLFLFFFWPHTCCMWKFLCQGSNLSHSYDLHHSCDNAGSLTPCTRPGIKPMPQQWPKLLQRHCWFLNARSLTCCTTMRTLWEKYNS